MEGKNSATLSSKDIAESDEFTKAGLKLHRTDQPTGIDGKISHGKSKRKRKLFLNGKHVNIGRIVVQPNNPSHSSIKRRRYIPNVDDDEDEGCDQNTTGIVDGTIGSSPQVPLLQDGILRQIDCCPKPLDEPTWRGIFKIDGKKYISLAGHLTTKYSKEVWNLTRSLQPIIKVTKVSRLLKWPEIWKASIPTGDSIGLFFLPHKMRHDEEPDELDQLIEEVKENDLILQGFIGEVEMLILPSILLPKRYQTFRSKQYLWAIFKPRETNSIKSPVPLENQQLPAASRTQQVQAWSAQASGVMGPEPESFEQGMRLGDPSCYAACTTSAAAAKDATDATPGPAEADDTVAADLAIVPAEANPNAVATDAAIAAAEASSSANSAATLRINWRIEDTPGSMFSIVVQKNSELEKKLDRFIQDNKHDGALLAYMKGEAKGAGP
ncbi:hypothetical protein ACP4OV_003195 [Aristida adscensionis]